jgi:molybdate transport system substrate-binding protein
MARPLLLLTLCLTLASESCAGEPLRLAVAANFRHAAEQLAATYTELSGYKSTLQVASTGMLYAQIIHGAPFHVFLAADSERPQKLVQAGLAEPESRMTYAVGELVLVPPGPTPDWAENIRSENPRVAIANPTIAPYGKAALEALNYRHVDIPLHKLIKANNVAQAFQMWDTGNTDYALVSRAQAIGTQHRIIPFDSYTQIDQQAVLLKRGTAHPAAGEFMKFLKSDRARQLIRASGYGLASIPQS